MPIASVWGDADQVLKPFSNIQRTGSWICQVSCPLKWITVGMANSTGGTSVGPFTLVVWFSCLMPPKPGHWSNCLAALFVDTLVTKGFEYIHYNQHLITCNVIRWHHLSKNLCSHIEMKIKTSRNITVILSIFYPLNACVDWHVYTSTHSGLQHIWMDVNDHVRTFLLCCTFPINTS